MKKTIQKLIISVSGIRGIIGETLTPDIALRFALAFGSFIKAKKKVIIGRDTRITGEMMASAVISGLVGTGCEVIDIGIAPTPTVQFLVKTLNADGGIVISASHNPVEWNALKLYKKGGILLNKKEGESVKKIFSNNSFQYVKWNKYKNVVKNEALAGKHVDRVLDSLIFKNKIVNKKFTVGLDSCNASGSFITPELLNKLGCTIKGLFIKPDGLFPHDPEPNMKNLQQMINFIKKNKVDAGFAQDSDADRLAVLDENGDFLSEEYTLALAVYYILSIYDKTKKLKKYSKSVVVNLSTTRMIDDIAKIFNAKVYRTPVGEINVVEKMIKTKSVIGGEGNGGVIFPPINYGRDSLAGIGLILDYMAYSGEKLSCLIKKIPSYVMLKTKFSTTGADISRILKSIEKKYSSGKINRLDGIKIDLPDGWFHIRSSNTEPVVRLIIEAKNKKILNNILQELKKYFNLH